MNQQPKVVSWDEKKELKKAGEEVLRKRNANSNFFSTLFCVQAMLTLLGAVQKKTAAEQHRAISNRKKMSRERRQQLEKRDEERMKRFTNDVQLFSSTVVRRVPAIRTLLQDDISNGLECFPIPSFSETQSWDLCSGFEYIKENKVDKTPMDKRLIVSCDCKGDCDENCCCVVANERIQGATISVNGIENLVHPMSAVNFSCGVHCKCKGDCSRSIKRHLELEHKFEVFKKNDSIGFSLRVMNAVMPGQIITQFSGEVIEEDELQRLSEINKGHMDYSFSLFGRSVDDLEDQNLMDELKMSWEIKQNKLLDGCANLFVDPFKKGNVARFISHGCLPNTGLIKVISNNLHPSTYRLFIVANQPIAAGEELFINYGYGHTVGNKICLCGHIGCRVEYLNEWSKLAKDERLRLLTLHSDMVLEYNEELQEEFNRITDEEMEDNEREDNIDDNSENDANNVNNSSGRNSRKRAAPPVETVATKIRKTCCIS